MPRTTPLLLAALVLGAAAAWSESDAPLVDLDAKDRCTWERHFDSHDIHPFHDDADSCRSHAESRGFANTALHEDADENHHGELDERINDGWPAFEEALEEAGVDYEQYMYADANHGFHNDTTPRFDEAAAALAWGRTIEFFERHLSES